MADERATIFDEYLVEDPEFEQWYKGHAERLGLSPDPDDPMHFYDYRAAFKAGADPDAAGHWPSEFKKEGHPTYHLKERPTIFDEYLVERPMIEEAEETSDLAERVRRGEIMIEELPRDVQKELGYLMPGEMGPFGMMWRGEPIQVVRPETREWLLKSPKALAAIEGLGEVAGISIPDEEKPPTVEDVYGREKTLGEKGITLGTQLLAELPVILAAETGVGLLLPSSISKMAAKKFVDYSAKELAVRGMAQAVRSGTTGALFHGAMEFADQMFDPEDVGFDPMKLLGAGAEGFKWWGLFGAATAPVGWTLGKYFSRNAKNMRGIDKLKTRAGNSDLTVTRLVDDASLAKYERPVIEVRAKDGTRKIFGSVKATNQFLSSLEKNDAVRYASVDMWKEFRGEWTRAVAEVETKYLADPREIGALEGATYGKLVGNIMSLFQRVENKFHGPMARMRVRRAAMELGKTAEEIPHWMAKHQRAYLPFRLYTRLAGPAMDAERRATRTFNRLYDYAWRRLYKPVKELSRKIDKSEDQIYDDIFHWMGAAGRREAVDPKFVASQIKRWRRYIEEEGLDILPKVNSMISKFMKERNMPETARPIFQSLVHGKHKQVALAPSMIERRFGKMIRPAPSEPERTLMAPAETRKMKRLKRELMALPEHQRVAIEQELGEPLRRVEELEALLSMTPEEVEIAKRFRKFYRAMFNIAGLDADNYLKWYIPMIKSGEVLTLDGPGGVYSKMKGVPDYIKSKIRFFAEMHRQGEVFIPEKNVAVLTNKYMWGASRARHLAPLVNFARTSPEMLNARILKGTPIQRIADKYVDDIVTGMPNREKAAMFMALKKFTGGKVPYEFWNELAETMISNVYGATMGLRAWLVIRNLTQPWITTVLVTGPRALTQAYLDIFSGAKWRDFYKQSIHMRKGGGLPYAEEIFRRLDKIGGRASWSKARQALAIMREFNYATTKPYQMADTLNRFVSYRAMMNRVENGLSKHLVGDLSRRVRTELEKVITERIPPEKFGKPWRSTLVDIKKSRFRASRAIEKSKELDALMKSTGLNSAFLPAIVEDYKVKLSMLLTAGEISKAGMERVGGKFFPYGLKTPQSIERVIREAFLGKTGKLQEALMFLDPRDKVMTKAISEGFRDSFAKKAARQVVAETQWLYERKVQAPWLQKRWFGMFMTWPSNYIDFLNRHFRYIGTAQDKIAKAGMMGGVYGGLVAGLTYAGISPHYLYRSFAVPTGGPAAQALFDIAGLTAPIPQYEKASRLRRLAEMPEQLLVPTAQITKSVYSAVKGRKPPVRGLLGAPMSRSQYAEWHRPEELGWDTSKITKNRLAAIRRLRDDLRAMDMARKTHEDPNVRKMAEERYNELWWALERIVRPVVKYIPGDVGLVADRILEQSEEKK